MRVGVYVISLACVAGCGLPELIVPDPPPPPEKPWVAPPAADVAATAKPTTESAKLVADEGSFTLTTTLDGRKRSCTVGIDQVSLRVGDLPSLNHVLGHVKIDPLDMVCGEPSDDAMVRAVLETLFIAQGAPIQIFFDVGSVGNMVGRLAAAGDKASGVVLGELQINDHKANLDVAAGFAREPDGKLLVTIPETPLDLEPYDLVPKLSGLATRLYGRKLGATVQISGSFHLTPFAGDKLPSFIRVPVTVNRVSTFERRLDAEIANDVVARRRLSLLGFPTEMAEKFDAQDAEAMDKLKAVYNRANDVDFDRQAERSGTRVAGEKD